MELSFFGVQKEGKDSFSFFQKLEERGLDYDVDLEAGRINISKIEDSEKHQVIKIVSETFDIINIRSRAETKTEDEEVKNERKIETITSREIAYIEDALERIKDTLKKKNFPINKLYGYVSCICRELKSIDIEPNAINIVPGEIVICELGLAGKGESYGRLPVLVLQNTVRDKYWVVPINLNPVAVYDDKFNMKIKKDEDATYYNSSYKTENAMLYLSELKEVSSVKFSELINKVGKVTDKFLKEVRKRIASLITNDAGISIDRDKSYKKILEKRIRTAIEKSLGGEKHDLNMETFLKEMRIPTDSVYLAKAFETAYANLEKTLSAVVHLLIVDQKLESNEWPKMQKILRNEFVEWMKSEHYDIYMINTKISLGEVFKAFIDTLDEIVL